jgi:hypothetical protein
VGFISVFKVLSNTLRGIRIGRKSTKTSVVAFADDVTIFLTSSSNIPKLKEAIECNEKASGAEINLRKSKAIQWDRREKASK